MLEQAPNPRSQRYFKKQNKNVLLSEMDAVADVEPVNDIQSKTQSLAYLHRTFDATEADQSTHNHLIVYKGVREPIN